MPDASPATQSLQDQLDDLHREVGQLRDREAIRTVLDTYAFLLDSGRWRDIPRAVFTDDAVDHHSPAAARSRGAGSRAPGLPRLGSDRYGARDR